MLLVPQVLDLALPPPSPHPPSPPLLPPHCALCIFCHCCLHQILLEDLHCAVLQLHPDLPPPPGQPDFVQHIDPNHFEVLSDKNPHVLHGRPECLQLLHNPQDHMQETC